MFIRRKDSAVFYITSSRRLAERIYEISCEDAIGVLGGSGFPAAMYTNKNAVELITEIIDGDFDLEIDEIFNSATVTGYIPPGTRREALLHVCFAIGAIADTSGTTGIDIMPVSYINPLEIPQERTYFGSAVDTEAIVTSIEVTAHTYTQGSGTSGDDIVEVDGVKYVHTTSITVVENPIVVSGDKQNVVEFKSATLVNQNNVVAVAQRVYSHYTKRDTLNARIVAVNEKPGDYVRTVTPWGAPISGNIEEMTITLSNTVAADVKIKSIA